MSNKDIEKDIKILRNITKQDFNNPMGWTGYYDSELKELQQAIKNILADRERLIDVASIAKELDLQEDATIDEIYIAIRILKSKRTDMFEYIDRANKYDRLVEKIKKDIEEYPEATYTKYYLLDCIGLL